MGEWPAYKAGCISPNNSGFWGEQACKALWAGPTPPFRPRRDRPFVTPSCPRRTRPRPVNSPSRPRWAQSHVRARRARPRRTRLALVPLSRPRRMRLLGDTDADAAPWLEATHPSVRPEASSVVRCSPEVVSPEANFRVSIPPEAGSATRFPVSPEAARKTGLGACFSGFPKTDSPSATRSSVSLEAAREHTPLFRHNRGPL